MENLGRCNTWKQTELPDKEYLQEILRIVEGPSMKLGVGN